MREAITLMFRTVRFEIPRPPSEIVAVLRAATRPRQSGFYEWLVTLMSPEVPGVHFDGGVDDDRFLLQRRSVMGRSWSHMALAEGTIARSATGSTVVVRFRPHRFYQIATVLVCLGLLQALGVAAWDAINGSMRPSREVWLPIGLMATLLVLSSGQFLFMSRASERLLRSCMSRPVPSMPTAPSAPRP